MNVPSESVRSDAENLGFSTHLTFYQFMKLYVIHQQYIYLYQIHSHLTCLLSHYLFVTVCR